MAGNIYDDFNRADSTTALGTSSSGHAWNTDASHIMGINGNRAYGVNDVSYGWVNLGTPNIDMSVTLLTDDAGGFFFRNPSGTSDVGWYFRSGGASYGLGVNDGVGEALDGGAQTGGTTNAGDRLRVVAEGHKCWCYVNDSLIMSGTSSYGNANTWHGITAWNFGTNRFFEDFQLYALPPRQRIVVM